MRCAHTKIALEEQRFPNVPLVFCLDCGEYTPELEAKAEQQSVLELLREGIEDYTLMPLEHLACYCAELYDPLPGF